MSTSPGTCNGGDMESFYQAVLLLLVRCRSRGIGRCQHGSCTLVISNQYELTCDALLELSGFSIHLRAILRAWPDLRMETAQI